MTKMIGRTCEMKSALLDSIRVAIVLTATLMMGMGAGIISEAASWTGTVLFWVGALGWVILIIWARIDKDRHGT